MIMGKIKANRKRGYYGIGVYEPKTTENIGTLWRSAFLFGADFIFTIGARYHKQPTDTTKAWLHLPLYNYTDFEDFLKHVPEGCEVVCIEQDEKAKDLPVVNHSERVIYLLGAEDYGIPKEYLKGRQTIQIPYSENFSANVAVAGSIVMYDRFSKAITVGQTDTKNKKT